MGSVAAMAYCSKSAWIMENGKRKSGGSSRREESTTDKTTTYGTTAAQLYYCLFTSGLLLQSREGTTLNSLVPCLQWGNDNMLPETNTPH